MNIGIFGTGNVGRTLAERFVADGDTVMIGTRDVQHTLTRDDKDVLGHPPYKVWHETHPEVTLGTFETVAKFADLIVLATHGEATANAIRLAGTANFGGKTVIDMTNPLDVSRGIPPAFTGVYGNSLGEQFQQLIPDADVVKTFNFTSVGIVVNPQREDGNATLFVAGNNAEAKKTVCRIAQRWGWKDHADLGDISQAYWLETLGITWIYYAFKNNSWTHAFSLLRK